MRNKQCNG
jgi:hypothetical protein